MYIEPKKLKEQLKIQASKDPEKYYPTTTLKELGFIRKKCTCGTFFWTVDTSRQYCGDPKCSGGFLFLQREYTKNKMSYLDVWKNFSSLFKKFGYTPINRFPTWSRWNPTTDFTVASIAAFQPHVVSGEADPPANPLVIPQFCLRFNDVDNIGKTGHMALFSMIGQHAFVPPQKYDINQYLKEIHHWLTQGMGIKNSDITFHEDAWVGGNSCGHSMEFFSGGLELGNQVYMQYEITESGLKDLKIKVLDMGMGQERCAWFSQGKATAYDVTFPKVMKKLYGISGLNVDEKFMAKFIPYSAYLNIDEVEDINKAWKEVADKIGTNVAELRETILPLSALYCIGEHSRALLVALHDGALPSNVGGGYNLRILARRCFNFIEKYQWDIDLFDLCAEHAKELRPQDPGLLDNLDEIKKILDVEEQKYKATKQKSVQIIQEIMREKITPEVLVRIYDSHGITPELLQEEATKRDKKVEIPENFYARVSALHEKREQVHATKKEVEIALDDVPATKILYYDDYRKLTFKARVVRYEGKYLVLDQTSFYGTSGGQVHDTGFIHGKKVVDVIKSGNKIVHVLGEGASFKVGQEVEGKIDEQRRIQLAQHHTTAHIINAAARKVLGKHINQASAYKDVMKGRLDITHYASLTKEEVAGIEQEANSIVAKKIPVLSTFMPRSEAEKKYGFSIYQGGVPIGKELRIIEIKGIDVEACGGTHLKNTSEAGKIKIIGTSKISDAVVRIEYVSGNAALEEGRKEHLVLAEIAALLNVKKSQVPGRAEELFTLWKDIVKKKKKIQVKFTSMKEETLDDKELLEKTAALLKTQPEHLVKTITRFLKDLEPYS